MEGRSILRRSSVNDSPNMPHHRANYGAIRSDTQDSLLQNQDDVRVEPINQYCWIRNLWERYKGNRDGHDALDHALSNEFESLDYEDFHNKIYIADEVDKGQAFVRKRSVLRWVVMLFIGIFTALVAVFVDIMIDLISTFKHKVIQSTYKRFTETDPFPVPLFAWVGINCVLVIVAAVLVAYVSPVAAGSGIPQIKCYLNGVKIPKVVRIKTLICKAIGVVFSVAGGLAVGKEGPMIHSGAVIAAGISQGRSRLLNKDFKIFEYFRNDHEKRDFVSGGAAAGVSAAFGAPVGGVLFSLEEGASFWNQGLTWRIFFSSMISYFTLNSILSFYHHRPGELQYQGLLNFGSFTNLNYEYWEIPLTFIPIGVIGGLLGALFNAINIKLTKFRLCNITRPWTKVAEAVLVACVSASVFFLFIYFVNDCHPYTDQEMENPVQGFCNDGQVSSVANLLLQTPEKSVRKLFHDSSDSYDLHTLGIFFAIYFFLALWTYGLSVPSGLFIPCLLCGASWGRLYGRLMKDVASSISVQSASVLDPGKYALIGAAAQLGGVVRMTISLTVILMEATGNVSFGLPIMIVLMVAKWVGDLFTEGIYDEHIGLAKVPMLAWEAPPITTHRRAVEVMSTPVTVFRPIEKVSVILKYLKMYKHNGFPIVTNFDPDMVDAVGMETYEAHAAEGAVPRKKLKRFGRLVGFVNRSQIIVLLKRLHFLENASSLEHESYADSLNPNLIPSTSGHRPNFHHTIRSQPSHHSLYSQHSQTSHPHLPPLRCEDFRDAYPRYPDIETLDIPESLLGCHIDFRAYMNDSPYHMNYRATLPRLFSLFRALGLRHVTITDNQNFVVGMVTRVDIARFREVWNFASDQTHEVLPIAKRA